MDTSDGDEDPGAMARAIQRVQLGELRADVGKLDERISHVERSVIAIVAERRGEERAERRTQERLAVSGWRLRGRAAAKLAGAVAALLLAIAGAITAGRC